MKQNNNNDQGGSGNMLSSIQFFNALNKYIPSLVLQNWIEQQKTEDEFLEAERRANRSIKHGGEKEKKTETTITIPVRIKQQLPFIQDMETVVLFADISGFTNISEACAKLGIRGNEELAFCINRYMEGMVKNLAKFGGDIIKFVGDAMIVMWPRTKLSDDPDGNGNVDDEKVTVIRKAIQCAYDIQKELNNKKIMANVTNLSVKIGIAYGKCALLYVGGVFERSEFFTVGSALTHALKSEEQATSGGQIIVSDTAFRFVKSVYYDGEEIISEEKKRFFRVTKVIQGVRGRADAVLLKSQIKHDRMTAIQKSLRSCVPAAIMPYLEIGYEQYGSETRALTVMFASLGVDLSSASSAEGMKKIQKIVVSVQQQVYRLEGSLNKLVMDDKGSTLICIWGACPMAHNDDPQRAILTAMNMRTQLNKIENTWCNVGIATGDVFSGVVGTSGSRKEFSVLGDTVNLAARIMFYPLKFGKRGQINCCLRTKNEAMNTLNFKYYDHCEFKGKSISIPIYSPMDPRDELYSKEVKDHLISPLQMLKLHFNPLIVQKEVNHKRLNEPFIGKNGFMNEIYEKMKQYLFGQRFNGTPDNKEPLSIIISGKSGTGKTHLMRALCEKIMKDSDFVKAQASTPLLISKNPNSSFMGKSNHRFPLFATTNNCNYRMKFLGTWRPILHNMIIQRSKNLNVSKDELLKRIIMKNKDKVDILLEIFGAISNEEKHLEHDFIEKQRICKNINIDKEQVEPITKNSPVWFLLSQRFSKNVNEAILDVVLYFIKEFTGDEDELFHLSDEEISLSQESSRLQISQPDDNLSENINKKKKHQQNSNKDDNKKSNPCILIFDQASIMEEESYSLILRVFDQCSNVIILFLLDQDQKGDPTFPKLEFSKNQADAMKINEQKMNQKFIDCSYVYDMPSVTKKELRKMLIDLAPKYQTSYSEEIRLMTDIKDPEKTIKTYEKSREWLDLLSKKHNLHAVYKSIDSNIIDCIMQKCQGNVIYCLQFFFNLLTNGYIEINRNQEVVECGPLVMCRRLQNFTKIPVPTFALKKRLKNLDSFLKEGKNPKYKGNVRKQEIHVKGLMLLKTAAIIGEEFGTLALKKIIPLRNETHSSIQVILKELEQAELIEILDETDMKNIHCRFNQSFLRESIYQVMLYRDQKQVLHQQLADFIQSLPSSVMSKEQIETEIDKLRDHILIGEDCQTEEELPFKQKYGIIVKQMQNILINNNHNIPLYQSFVFKQGKKASKKISKRLLILNSRDLVWFHNTKEYETNQQPLGIIKVENIFKVFETLMQSGTFDFEVAVTQYIRKGVLDSNVRNIKFGCETENDRNHWISRIEFLKAKLVYDQYVNKFVNIQFPLKKEEDFAEDDSEQKRDALIEQLHQFGKNFKANTRIDHSVINPHFQKFNSIPIKKQMNRQSNLSLNSIQRSFTLDYDSTVNQNAQDLAEKLGKLYNASIVNVLQHVNANSNKSQNIGITKKLGKLPDYYQPDWIYDNKDGNEERPSVSNLSAEKNMMYQNVQSPTKLGVMVKQQSQKSQRYINQDSSSPSKLKNQMHTRNSVPNEIKQDIQEIKEMDEGSSSNGDKRQHDRGNKKTDKRMSEKVKSEAVLPQEFKNIQNNVTESKGKSSKDHVTMQLNKLEEQKKQDEATNKRFTFNVHPLEKQQIAQNIIHPQVIKPSYTKDYGGAAQGIHRANKSGQNSSTHNISSQYSDVKRLNSDLNNQDNQEQMPIRHQGTSKFNQNVNNVNQPLDGLSSINENITEYGYHTRGVPNEIQQEINTQINLGLRQFFEKLDSKLTAQRQQLPNNNMNSYQNQTQMPDVNQPLQISMRQLFDSTMVKQNAQNVQETRNPKMLQQSATQGHLHSMIQRVNVAGFSNLPISRIQTIQNEMSPIHIHQQQYLGQLHNISPNRNSPGFNNIHFQNHPIQHLKTIPRSAQQKKNINHERYSSNHTSRASDAQNRNYRKIIESHPESKAGSSDEEPNDPDAMETTYNKRNTHLKQSQSQKLV